MIDWQKLPLAMSDTHITALSARYGETQRAYHTLCHLEEMLEHYREVERDLGWAAPRETLAALLYHDAVYVPGAKDNEAKSAALANAAILGEWSGLDAARVERLILLTAKHGHLGPAEVSVDEALFLDADMAILAAPAARFAEYEKEIAREYVKLPKLLFKLGRRRFLARLLASPRIYLSDYFFERLEKAARANLARAV